MHLAYMVSAASQSGGDRHLQSSWTNPAFLPMCNAEKRSISSSMEPASFMSPDKTELMGRWETKELNPSKSAESSGAKIALETGSKESIDCNKI